MKILPLACLLAVGCNGSGNVAIPGVKLGTLNFSSIELTSGDKNWTQATVTIKSSDSAQVAVTKDFERSATKNDALSVDVAFGTYNIELKYYGSDGKILYSTCPDAETVAIKLESEVLSPQLKICSSEDATPESGEKSSDTLDPVLADPPLASGPTPTPAPAPGAAATPPPKSSADFSPINAKWWNCSDFNGYDATLKAYSQGTKIVLDSTARLYAIQYFNYATPKCGLSKGEPTLYMASTRSLDASFLSPNYILATKVSGATEISTLTARITAGELFFVKECKKSDDQSQEVCKNWNLSFYKL